MIGKLDASKAWKLLLFYFRLMAVYPQRSIIAVLSGFCYRVLNIGIFVLILKIFLMIIDPSSALELLNKIAPNSSLNIDDPQLVAASLLGFLALIIVIHFIVGKINLAMLRFIRHQLQLKGPQLALHENLANRRNISLDQLPIGFESIVKVSEILLFFVFVMTTIFWMNVFLGMLVILTVPVFVAFLVIRGREEIFVLTELRESRQQIGQLSEDEYASPVMKSAEHFALTRNNLLYSDFIGGLLLAAIMTGFLFYNQEVFSSLSSLILIFSLRFALVYAKELSNVMRRLVQQRTLLGSAHTIDLSPLRDQGL